MSCSVVVATTGRRPAQLAALRRALDAQAEPPGGFEVVVVTDSARRGPSSARNEGIERLLTALRPFGGPPQATLIGRGERADMLLAALVNGHAQSAHSYNDTHLATVAHPTGPVAAPILALAERQEIGGAEWLHAMIVGIEKMYHLGA